MTDNQPMLEAAEALKFYRQGAPEKILQALVGFRSLSASDQRELLFFMVLHANSNTTQALEALGMQYVANQQPQKVN
jgi:hypothetical protein